MKFGPLWGAQTATQAAPINHNRPLKITAGELPACHPGERLIPSKDNVDRATANRENCTKILERNLSGKVFTFNELTSRYTPELRDALSLLAIFANRAGHLWIAGGSLLASKLDKPIKDVDIFFTDRGTRLAVLDYLLSMGYVIGFVTANATTMTKDGHPPIQLINNHYYDNMLNCLLGFDICASQFGLRALDSRQLNAVSPSDSVFNMDTKRYVLNVSPVGDARITVRRIVKYAKQYGLSPVYNRETYEVLRRAAELGSRDREDLNPSCVEDYAFPMDLSSLWTAATIDLSTGELYDVLGDMTDCYGSPYDLWLGMKNSLDKRLNSVWSVEHCTKISMDLALQCAAFPFAEIHKNYGFWPSFNEFLDAAPSVSDFLEHNHRWASNLADWSGFATTLFNTDESEMGTVLNVLLQLSVFLDTRLTDMRGATWRGASK